MSIKLKGSSDGSVSFDAPADTSPSGSDITLTLPTSAGSANQFLKNSGIAGELEYSSMVETSTGIGIGGVTSPFDKLQVRTATDCNFVLSSAGGTEASFEIFNNAGSSNTPLNYRASEHKFKIQANEKMRLDSSGRLLVGTTSNFVRGNIQAVDNGGGEITVGRSDTSVSNGNDIGHLFFCANDSDPGALVVANISCFAEANYSSGSAPANLRFSVVEGGSTSPTERMRITSNGNLLVGTTSETVGALSTAGQGFRASSTAIMLQVASNATDCAIFNRTNNDGDIISLRQNGTQEGTISVSGTTISYNGGHLTRWSQLAGGAERIEILRGSVLSNLDEMCEWAYEAQDAVLYTEEDELPEGASVGDVKTSARDSGTEDNEQLNRMKVSDVEGDPNVAGVFQAWDDDDDTYTNDFYCAMTGDFVIRIAQGTTVARGDLLMSAGDGTAKPQDDDIVRSKTIAKVTSTTVSTTYSDGSYCVPCVLMAC